MTSFSFFSLSTQYTSHNFKIFFSVRVLLLPHISKLHYIDDFMQDCGFIGYTVVLHWAIAIVDLIQYKDAILLA